MRLGDDIDLGGGITGKVIGRTFEQDTRVDLLTPWGVLNGVRLTALMHGLALNPEREDVSTLNQEGQSTGAVTVDLETPWGRLRAVPLAVIEAHAERRRAAPAESVQPATLTTIAAQAAVSARVRRIQMSAENNSSVRPLALGPWPRRRPSSGAGRRVA